MTAPDTWLLTFCALLALVLGFAAVKARRLHRMPLYVPAFVCGCGGVLLALLQRLKTNKTLDAPLHPMLAKLDAGSGAAGLLLGAQLLAAVTLLYILARWLRPPKG